MRAVWKGHIRFSLVTIPVRIYNAIETAQTISFKQLHKEDHGPIGYDKRCKKCNEVVKMDEIVKGYPYEPDQFVILEPEDFEKVKLKSTKVIEIEGFVDATEVHPTLYDTPYFAGPDGEVAAKAYNLLCTALKKSGKIGVGRVVIRDRENVMLLAPEKNGIMMYKLRSPKEIRDITHVPLLEEESGDTEQLKLAQTLIDSMSKPIDKIDMSDRYKDALREMIQAKVDGKELVTVEEEKAPVVDIMTALKASIDGAKAEKKPMKKATGKKPAAKSKARKSSAQESQKKSKTA